ncbi:MAG: c-type cytochrome [Fimbriimonadaceae bacterium]|nr:c-type cytochrome [Chitinophagales bacterium]
MLNLKLFRFHRLLLVISLSVTCFLFNASFVKADVIAGKALFEANCQRCHIMGRESTGPNLVGVTTRGNWTDSTSLYKWIKNSQGYLASSGDTYAAELYKKYGSIMPAFANLSDADISNILMFVNGWEPPTLVENGGSDETASNDNTALYIIIIAILGLVAFILSRSVKQLQGMVRQKHDDPEPDPIPWYKKRNYRPIVGVLALLLFSWLSIAMYNSATSLGRQTGYAPDQPIAFSHKIHAGINKIDCRYCHVGAERGKAAVIPSLSVCMNCHYNIQELSENTPEYPKSVYDKEIKKIYEYAGFDAATLKYTKEATPIKWVKVHNLPDHVYFNHSQHVKVAGLECQSCHGMVQEMDVVEQVNNLSMGWCLNCHRQTEVNFTNGFYKDYEDLHNKLESGEIKAVHAEDIGATDCQRCHY